MHNKIHHNAGFTLIEMIISVALIAIAISIFVQTSGVFNDRLSLILKRVETDTSLLRLAVYLRDLSQIADSTEISVGQETAAFSREGEGVFAKCSFDMQKRDVSCAFNHQAGVMVVVQAYSLADHGFADAFWASSTLNNIERFALILDPAKPKSRSVKIDFGILPGVREIFP